VFANKGTFLASERHIPESFRRSYFWECWERTERKNATTGKSKAKLSHGSRSDPFPVPQPIGGTNVFWCRRCPPGLPRKALRKNVDFGVTCLRGADRVHALSLAALPLGEVIDSSVIDSLLHGRSFSARSVVRRNGSSTRGGHLACHSGGAS
jgi:hypothetical protein